jgi:FAD/FMN-containing dehydrogenase
MQPSIPFSEVKAVASWSNFHGTVRAKVATYCTPDVIADAGDDSPRRLARHGRAIDALLSHCFAHTLPLRVLGSAWSLSRIVEPSAVVLDPANLNVVVKVKPAWVEAAFKQAKPSATLVFAQGGATISSLNRRLGQAGLALQTSGASDGHRVAGCIATGTHGSAIDIGAVHDTIRAVHLVTGPQRALLLQPAQGAACTDDVAAWLARETGIPTESVRDDELFDASLVALGSLGIVHGVVLEAVPLYKLRRRKLAFAFDDATLREAVRTLNTAGLHPGQPRPYHFEVVLQPYPEHGAKDAYAVLMWKEPHDGGPLVGPTPGRPEQSNEVIDLIGELSGRLDGPIGGAVIKKVVRDTLSGRYKPGDTSPRFPGQMFGWTSTPPGNVASTEIVVDHARTQDAVDAIYAALRAHDGRGELLLGAVALRFVPQTRALLGMNVHPRNTFIELPSIRSDETRGIYASCYAALRDRAIPFTCHWGQQHELDASQLASYFGARADRWRTARARLLPEAVARRVFASADLASFGLG